MISYLFCCAKLLVTVHDNQNVSIHVPQECYQLNSKRVANLESCYHKKLHVGTQWM